MLYSRALFIYLVHIEWCVFVNSKLLVYPHPTPIPFGNFRFVFYVCESICFVHKFLRITFLDSTYK